MKAEPTVIPDVVTIDPKVFGDERGFFMETWNAVRFAEAGLDLSFVQDNQSRSARGVLRGIHYQVSRPQGKLVRVTAGRVFDVAVDLRRSSTTFGQWVGVELSAENKRMLWVPPGFGHGFLALEDRTDLVYKCTDFYSPDDERCLAWDDPAVGIVWPLDGIEPILSQKDQGGRVLAEAELYT
ncbi:MAG: dTDP-4-dehydrorhamnose 3,5-epimerase [Novosphingobium sp.]